MSGEPTDFERVGGEPGLRAIIEDFTERVYRDVMIGFLFHGKDHKRITELEFRLAAEQLGGPFVYKGRPMGEAHRKSPIMGGHFMRRRKILENTLRDHGVDEGVTERWLAHVDALRDQVLGRGVDANHCDHDLQKDRLAGG